jgi:hypothetical protein
VSATIHPTKFGALAATVNQAATPPASGVLVTVPSTVSLYRQVYGTVTVEAATGDTVTIEVETGVATGAYDAVQYIALGSTDETANVPYSFLVAPGRRYRFTLAGGGVAFVHYNYVDT